MALDLATLVPGYKAAADLVEPAYLWVPEHEFSSGPEVVDFAASFGRTHGPEERLALELMYAEQPNGQWLTLEDLLVVNRQNFKTFTAESAAIADLFLFDNELVIWTAHLFDTTQESFRHIHAIVDNYDHLRRRVKKITTGNGDEGIELVSGARMKFRARSSTGGRGLTGDVLYLDEAFAVVAAMIGALMPTLSSVPNPKIRYLSSPGLATSEVLRDLRDRGRSGDGDRSKGDPSLSYAEWGDRNAHNGCASDDCDHHRTREGCALDDLDRIRNANPAMRRGRITEKFVRAERRSMPAAEYARERAGWWDEPKGEAAISSGVWEAGLDEESQIEEIDEAEFAIDVSPLSSSAAIGVAGLTGDEAVHVELTGRDGVVDHRDGIEWVVPRVRELVDAGLLRRVAIAGGTAAEALAPAIERISLPDSDDEFVEVVRISGIQVAASCQNLYNLAAGRNLRHVGQAELDGAVVGTRWKNVGEGARMFARRSSAGDITPTYAVALAAWLVAKPDDEDDDTPLDDDEIYSSIH